MDEFIFPPIARYIDKYHLTGKFLCLTGNDQSSLTIATAARGVLAAM